ncbi:MAG: hypothetical protein PHC37_05515 [Candidatus Omnitrophica bacterium]|nr:hypothetical protein [Candidatus Omnitrophota bacterium]
MGILSFEFNNITQKNDPVLLANSRTTETINNSDPAGNNSLPDIYYIILDAYGQADILKDEIGYNNSQFLDSLKARRFYVAEKSRSNYAWTMLSIPSALNMRYLNKDNISFGLNDPEVIRILRGKGYKIISLPSSGFYSVNINSDDEYIERRPCCFLPDLIETTWLYPLESLGAVNFIFNAKRQGILYQFETLGSIPRMKGAKFIYAHIFITHPPYVFNDDGSPLILSLPELFKPKNRSSNFWHNLEGIIYAKQLIFANKKIIELVDKIILESRIPPIIIIQGDHGPLLGYPPKPVTDFLLRQRMGILNAYYLPSKGKKYLYNNISPVNTFRLVFNTSFDMKYDLLPDISYYSTGEEGTSDFIRVPDEE